MIAAPQFTDGAERHPLIGRVHRVMVDFLPPGTRRVLEAGCGEGRVLELLRRRGVGEVVGLDLAPHPARWRGVAGAPPLVKGSLAKLPLADASFDAALCLFVYPPSGSRWAALRELARVVRPGGTLLFAMQNVLNPMMLARRVWRTLAFRFDRPIVSPRGVECRLASLGFRITRRVAISADGPYIRTSGWSGRAARLYHRWVSERPATAPVLGLTAVLRGVILERPGGGC